MTMGGWLCMITAVGSITILCTWCCWKVLTDKEDNPEDEIQNNWELFDEPH